MKKPPQRDRMKAETLAKFRAEQEAQTDWYATCPKCGRKLEGSLATLRSHRCENGSAAT